MTTATAQADVRDAGVAGSFAPSPSSSDYDSCYDGLPARVSPGFETRTLLSSLFPVPVEKIGTDRFIEAYCVNLERLSVQAHRTAGTVAAAHGGAVPVGGSLDGGGAERPRGPAGALSSLTGGDEEEYVVEAFLEEEDRLEALVRTLLALEAWRENVLFRPRKGAGGIAEEQDDDDEEEAEFEIEGGERRGEDDAYDALNQVDGGDDDDDAAGRGDGGTGLAHRLAANGNALRAAFVLHAETTVVSMLNLIFYRGVPAAFLDGGGGDDLLLSLVDYCARQLVFLGTPEESNPALSRQKNPLPASRLSDYLQRRSRIDEIRDSMYDSAYQTAVASVTLSRYLCENVEEMGPSLLSRMLEVHDFPLLMATLVEEPPWTRRRSIEGRERDGDVVSARTVWEKLGERNEWGEVPPADLLSLTRLEGQPWLALFHLTTSRSCRESYGLDEFRKSRLLRLRGHLHGALLDQLPALGEVARYLDELSILGVPPAGQGAHRPSSGASSSGLLLRRVDSVRESIVGKRGARDDGRWEGVIRTQWEEVFSRVTDVTDGMLRRIASEVYGGGMEDAVVVGSSVDGNSYAAGGPNHVPKEEPQVAADDWKKALSRPVQKVTLHIESGSSDSSEEFELVPKQNGAAARITDTPLGPFRRTKMSIEQTCGEGEAIFPHSKVVARVHFLEGPSSDSSDEAELSIASLALPTAEHTTSQNSYDEVGIALPETFSSKEWRQLGDLEGRSVVLQLGFKRLARGVVPAGSTLLRGYSLSQAFLSQPVVD